jgi:asparagine synthase (glutamine-hydrolysing)
MCGIFGSINFTEEAVDMEEAFAALHLRGPDSRGYSFDKTFGVMLGHTRLSIHDLSPLGHQPMVSSSGRFEIAFNGEVYNYQSLRVGLEKQGYSFRGDSDTEVMLACFELYGVVPAVKKFTGMFAFSLLDREKGELILVRDRLGEKPLYYTKLGSRWVWASTLSAFKAFAMELEVSRSALGKLLRYNYIPAPDSIFEGVYKLRPASILTVSLAGGRHSIETYWEMSDAVTQSPPIYETTADLLDELEKRLAESVKGQMQADVPLGAFLSGGVDSSLVVALMQKLGNQKIKTFSMGFEDASYNEAPFAKAVAGHLGTDHTEHIVSEQDILNVVPQLPVIYDEPFADSSQLPTFLVSDIAKREVTVALSGDGGDELFHGYKRYKRIQNWYRHYSGHRLSGVMGLLADAPPGCRALMSRLSFGALTQRQLLALGKMFQEKDEAMFYHLSISANLDPERYVIGLSEGQATCEGYPFFAEEFPRDYAFNDIAMYLPDDILAKVDRAAMGVSLETRVPLLDHRVVEFALGVPISMKERDGKGKWLLRELLYKYVPRELIERPKRGFAVPLGRWLRGPLRSWVEDSLSQETLRRQNYLCPRAVSGLWHEHLRGSDVSSQLWSILMFQSWIGAK